VRVALLSCAAAAAAALAACSPQPTFVSCEPPLVACRSGCFDLDSDDANCGGCGQACVAGSSCVDGGCVPGGTGACAVDNGGCSPDALCVDAGAGAECTCRPGFTGSGTTCAACATCVPGQFAQAPCTPTTDTTCAACAPPCEVGSWEVGPCSPFQDRTCAPCSTCGPGTYPAAPCGPFSDTMCLPCELGCVACAGPGPTCTACGPGLILLGGACVPASCGNAVREGGEGCDDGDLIGGDGCDATCQVEPDSYCFGEVLSVCLAGSCQVEPATALPLGPGFELDGAGTTSPAGLNLTQRSMVRTTTPVHYPVLVEATVVYSGDDVTYLGARGDGLRDPMAGGEPTDALRARLSPGLVELATGPGTTVIASTPAGFSPSPGTPYRVRYFDDGFFVSLEWINLVNPGEGIGLQQITSYHGVDDRAFLGGGDQGALTVSNLRVCSAPALPVTAGLLAHYSAVPSWTLDKDPQGNVGAWDDARGSGVALQASGFPVFQGGLIGGQGPGVDFAGGTGMVSASTLPLSTDVSFFAVLDYRAPAPGGAIAHHGDRDTDWSLEQVSQDPLTLHWQTNADTTNMQLTLPGPGSYVLAGVFAGNQRVLTATPLVGAPLPPVSIVDASHSISAGDKLLYLGSSDAGDASGAAIGEVVYFSRALDAGERAAVIANLRARWRPH
jgi:cysteine-rich repeat protein